MSNYIDIHTHKLQIQNQKMLSISNVCLGIQKIDINRICSVGFHPWHIGNLSVDKIETELMDAASNENVAIIGECGLDRSIAIDFAKQIEVFQLHIKIALQFHKPMLIHCVRSYSDIMGILKNNNFNIPLVFHDFKGDYYQVEQLLKFNSFFSFGESLFKNDKAIKVLQAIPISNIFFETDDADISIEKVYIRAAEILKISEENLKEEIDSNYNKIITNALA